MVQGSSPAQAPDQPENTEPGCGHAVSVIIWCCWIGVEHLAEQYV